MARPLRIAFPGAYCHVTSRGNKRKDVFKSRRDREKFREYQPSGFHHLGYIKVKQYSSGLCVQLEPQCRNYFENRIKTRDPIT